MGIYDHNSVVIGLVSVEGNGKLSLAMAVVLLPAISLPSTLWIEHKQPKMIKTYIDRIVGYVWAVFGLGGFLFPGFPSSSGICLSFCHITDDGNGDGTDGTDYKDEGSDSVRSGGSFGLCGVYLCTRFRPNTGFCIGFCFMMVIPGHYLNGMAKQDK